MQTFFKKWRSLSCAILLIVFSILGGPLGFILAGIIALTLGLKDNSIIESSENRNDLPQAV